MKAIILAGGFGTRLHSITGDKIPKCLVEIMDKPILYYIVRNMKKQGIDDITLALHHKADQFMDFCIRESVKYKIEPTPLGTGGGIKNCIDGTDPVLVVNGDTVTNIDYNDMLANHIPPLSIAVTQHNGHMTSAGIYIIDPSIFDNFTSPEFSFEQDVIPKLTKKFYTIEWFTDIGTPEGLEKAKNA